MGQMVVCPNCGNVITTNASNTSPHNRNCKCGKIVVWYVDKKTGILQVGLR